MLFPSKLLDHLCSMVGLTRYVSFEMNKQFHLIWYSFRPKILVLHLSRYGCIRLEFWDGGSMCFCIVYLNILFVVQIRNVVIYPVIL